MGKNFARITISLCVFGWIAVTLILVCAAVTSFKQKHYAQTQHFAALAQIGFWPIDQTLGRVSTDTHLVAVSLPLLKRSASLIDDATLYVELGVNGDASASQAAQNIHHQLDDWQSKFSSWLDVYQRTTLSKKILEQKIGSKIIQDALRNPDQLTRTSQKTIAAAKYLLTGDHRFIILLQNSDELRATGGFMGSYASIQLHDGVVAQLQIQDIYQPDGQFTGYVDPPVGAGQYLSGGKGLRLPDSNWNPDFPQSAQQIMQFFAFGKENQVEGVVAVNLHVAEQLMALIGPVYLPDYGQTVTAENLSSLARADRSQFFPGSQQKKQFLQALFTRLKIELSDAVKKDPESFVELLFTETNTKHIQAYARASELQQLIDEAGVTGQIQTHESPQYLFLVESNVGINKANRLVSRTVALELQPDETSLSLQFRNQNPVTSLRNEKGDYINYQRVFVPPAYRVHNLVVNGANLDHWDEQLIKTSSNEQLKQIGFLITVPALSTASAQLKLSHATLPMDKLVLQHQSGLQPTPYRITTPQKIFDVLLEKDIQLTLH